MPAAIPVSFPESFLHMNQAGCLSFLLLSAVGIALFPVSSTTATGAETRHLPHDFTEENFPAKNVFHGWIPGPDGGRGRLPADNGHSLQRRRISATAVAKDSSAHPAIWADLNAVSGKSRNLADGEIPPNSICEKKLAASLVDAIAPLLGQTGRY